MKIALAASLLMFLTACGTDSGAVAVDPGGEPGSAGTPMPTEIPAATGPVRTLTIATVMDTGTPELCLGAVAESYPPQCGGPELRGWQWSDHDGMFDHQGDIRWGEFVVSGTFDGNSVTAADAIPASLYDPGPMTASPTPSPGTAYSEAELTGISEAVTHLPGAQGAYANDGHVLVDVIHDDGTLQAWADEEYGENVVLVTSLLVDA